MTHNRENVTTCNNHATTSPSFKVYQEWRWTTSPSKGVRNGGGLQVLQGVSAMEVDYKSFKVYQEWRWTTSPSRCIRNGGGLQVLQGVSGMEVDYKSFLQGVSGMEVDYKSFKVYQEWTWTTSPSRCVRNRGGLPFANVCQVMLA